MINRLRSSHVGLLALGFWLASLGFDTLTSYHDRIKPVPGWAILAYGWLSLFGVSVAWLANPSLILALVVRNNAAALFAGLAALVSLHTFFLTAYPDGNSNVGIFGYGWGVLLWFIAIGLGLLHVGLAANDPAKPGISSDFAWMRSAGILWIVTVVIVFGFYAFIDRKNANTADSALLRHALIKRSPVCKLEPPAPAALLTTPVSIVEIPPQSGLRPGDVLRWGVPMVRLRDYDYSYIVTARDRILRIAPADGAASVIVDYQTQYDQKTRSSTHTLGISAQNQQTFSYTWNPDGPVQCPRMDYKKTIFSALGLNELPPEVYRTPEFVAAQGVITGQEPASSTGGNQNYNCPAGIGYSFETSRQRKLDGYPFFIGATGYVLPSPAGKSLCAGDSTYFYSTSRYSDVFTLGIAKRDAHSLQLQWSGYIQIKGATPALQENRTYVLSIEEKGDEIFVKTWHHGHDQVLLLQAPHPKTLPAPKK